MIPSSSLKIRLVNFLAAAICTSSAAFAFTPHDDEKQRVICKTQIPAGSRFAVRVCRTAAQWETMAEQNRRDFNETQNRPTIPIQ